MAPAANETTHPQRSDERVDVRGAVPFVVVHLMPLGAVVTGVRGSDLLLCLGLYAVRMLGLTVGYHRHFAHQAFKVGRKTQLVLAILGSLSAQKGVLWWVGHHRHHHRFSDTERDVHSPRRGLWWSHLGWILCDRYLETRYEAVGDLARFPELVWLNRWWLVPPGLLGLAVWLVGGWSALFVGFFLSTVLLFHGTFVVNSLSHTFGYRRYPTGDTSKNNPLLSLLTLGEGWHNNHHHDPSRARHGAAWWELDLSYYLIKLMEILGIAWDVQHGARMGNGLLEDAAQEPRGGELAALRVANADSAPR